MVALAEKSAIPGGKMTPLEWTRIDLPVIFAGLGLASATFALNFSVRGWSE